jgi:hypothetical protein
MTRASVAERSESRREALGLMIAIRKGPPCPVKYPPSNKVAGRFQWRARDKSVTRIPRSACGVEPAKRAQRASLKSNFPGAWPTTGGNHQANHERKTNES